MDLHTDSIKSLPLWVQLPNLDVKYWGSNSLSKISSLLGLPIKTDRYTRDRTMINYARVLIEFPIKGLFPESVSFFSEHDILIHQPVKYKWLSTKCTHCGLFGHEEPVCKKKTAVRKEWRQVQDKNTKKDSVQSNVDANGVLPICKKDSVKANVPTGQPNPSVTAKNSMQATGSSGTITTDPLPQHTNKF